MDIKNDVNLIFSNVEKILELTSASFEKTEEMNKIFENYALENKEEEPEAIATLMALQDLAGFRNFLHDIKMRKLAIESAIRKLKIKYS